MLGSKGFVVTVSPRWLVVLLLLWGSCQRAGIDLDRLVGDEEQQGVGGSTSETSAGDTGSPPRVGLAGAGGQDSGDKANVEGGAAAIDPNDRLSRELCEDPLDPVQTACQLFGVPDDCSRPFEVTPTWEGCSATCGVCAEELEDYPYYRAWHPCCGAAKTCGAGPRVFCHERCPPPTRRDKIEPCYRLPRP